MPKAGATSVVKSKISDADKDTMRKAIEPISMRGLIAANSTVKATAAKVADDVEDMWDNMPV